MSRTYTYNQDSLTQYQVSNGNTLNKKNGQITLGSYTGYFFGYYGSAGDYDKLGVLAKFTIPQTVLNQTITSMSIAIHRIKSNTNLAYTVGTLARSAPTSEVTAMHVGSGTDVYPNRKTFSFNSNPDGVAEPYTNTYSIGAINDYTIQQIAGLIANYGYAVYGYGTPGTYRNARVDSMVLSITTNENQYAVTFNTKGGSSVSGSTFWDSEGYTITPNNPTREGYQFYCWTTDSTFKKGTSPEYQKGSVVRSTTAITLYAVWKKTYVCTFDKNGGGGGPSNQTFVDSGYDNTSCNFTLPSTQPTLTNYTFIGWKGTGSNIYQPGQSMSVSIDSSTLVAQWKVNSIIHYCSGIDSQGRPIWKTALVYMYNGTEWVPAIIKIWNGKWVDTV